MVSEASSTGVAERMVGSGKPLESGLQRNIDRGEGLRDFEQNAGYGEKLVGQGLDFLVTLGKFVDRMSLKGYEVGDYETERMSVEDRDSYLEQFNSSTPGDNAGENIERTIGYLIGNETGTYCCGAMLVKEWQDINDGEVPSTPSQLLFGKEMLQRHLQHGHPNIDIDKPLSEQLTADGIQKLYRDMLIESAADILDDEEIKNLSGDGNRNDRDIDVALVRFLKNVNSNEFDLKSRTNREKLLLSLYHTDLVSRLMKRRKFEIDSETRQG